MLGLQFYGFATGVFSSLRIEKATHESIPFRFIAGNLRPDHDTIANFRKSFLPEINELFVQVLLLAKALGVLKLGLFSLDGTRIHADAAKSHTVSYKRLLELETALRQQVAALLTLGEQVDQQEQTLPTGMVIEDEVALRQTRLERFAWRKPTKSWKLAPRSATRRNGPSMKPNWLRVRKKPGKPSAKRAGAVPRSEVILPERCP